MDVLEHKAYQTQLEVSLLPLKHAFAKTSIYSLRDKEKKT